MTALNEALSDADTQEPVKEPVKTELDSRRIPESDDDDIVMIRVKGTENESEKKPAEQKGAAKSKRVVEPITDSDHSDDEQQSEAAVDFGEEEEEDEVAGAPAKSNAQKPKQSEDPDFVEIENDDVGRDKSSGAGKDYNKEVQNKKKETGTSAALKKTKKTKSKELSPSKTIKKSKVDVKVKSKTTKAKQQTAVKKTSLAIKANEKASNKSTSPPSESISSVTKGEKLSKKTAKGKALVRKAVKPAPKTGKASSIKEKPLKAKKVIDKEEVTKEKKSPVRKNGSSTTAATTYSKKAKKVAGKSSATPAKEKTKSEITAALKKKKAGTKEVKETRKKKGREYSESDSNGQVDYESDNEGSVSDCDSMTDELAKTPSSKLPILGNLACSSRDQNAEALLDHAVQQLGRYNIVSYNAESNIKLAAYIIGSGTKRGWGLLQALVSGVPLISDNWLSGSISEGKWLPMSAFRSDKFGQSPRSVEGTANSGGKLLDGLRIRVVSEEKDASSIRKIVRLCGARLAQTRVDLVIHDTKRKIENTCPQVEKKWLADSIEAGVPLDYDEYLVGRT